MLETNEQAEQTDEQIPSELFNTDIYEPVLTLSVDQTEDVGPVSGDAEIVETNVTADSLNAAEESLLLSVVEDYAYPENITSDSDESSADLKVSTGYDDTTEKLTKMLLAANPPPAQQLSNFDFIFEAEPGNNDLTLRLSPQDQTILELVDSDDAGVLASCTITDVHEIIIYGVDDLDDTLTVDFNYGLIEVPITFHGGDAGFDSMVIEGGSFTNSTYTAISSDSGTILLDDVAIAYTGLEPITDNLNSTNRIFTATAGADHILLKNDTASGYMTIESSNGTFEYVTFINPATSLTINAGDGDDIVTIEGLDDQCETEIIINGGSGEDTLVGPDVTNSWELSGINAGSLTMSLTNLSNGPAVASFAEIENLTGGSGKDSFAFGSSGGVTGSIDNGGGTVELIIGGFVIISGDYSFVKGSKSFTLSNDDIVTADYMTIGSSGGTVFVGTGGGGSNPVGFSATLGSFALAIITEQGGSGRVWRAINGTISEASFSGIDNLTIKAANFMLNVNTAASDGTVVDFSEDPLTFGAGLVIDFDGSTGELFTLKGSVALNVFGFVLAIGDFEMTKATMPVVDGGTGNVYLTNASVLSMSLGIANPASVFAGTGGAFNDPNNPTALNTTNAVGFTAAASFSLAIIQDLQTPENKYIGLEFELVNASMDGITDMTLIVSASVLVNWASVGDRLNWSVATGANDTFNLLPAFTMTSAVELQIAGTMTLDAFGFVLASGGFKFTKGQMTVNDGAIEMVGASLLSIELQQVRLFAGVGASFNEDNSINTEDAIGFDAGTLTVTLAIVQDADTAANIYMGLEFDLLNAQLVGVDDDLTLIVSGGVKVNWASEGNRLDWITATNSTNDPINLIPAFSMTSAIEFQIDGSMTLGAFGFFYASGGFSLLKSSATLTVTDGTTSETPVEVDLLTIGSVVNYAFVGENGPYWVDDNDNGVIDNDETNDEAIGLELSNVEIGVALMTASQEGDQRYWAAIQAEVGTAELVGFVGLDLQLSNIGIAINLGFGTTVSEDDNETVVDFLASWDNNGNGSSDPDIDGLVVNTSDDSSLRLNFTDRLIQAFGQMYLVIGDFVYVSGSVAFQKGGTLTATLNDGTDTTDATEVAVSYMTVGASSVDIFVGVGPYFQDLDDDGIIDDEPADGAIGFVVENASFGLALLRSDTNSYYGISASLEGVGIVGLDAVEAIIDFDISNIAVKINGGNDGIRVVDFTKGNLDGDDATNGFTRVKTGAGANDYVDLNFSEELVEASATVTLKIDDFVYIHGSLAFKYSPEKTVNLSNGNPVTVSVLAIAATDVNAFMGIGPYDFEPGADNSDAVGLVVNNLSFGFAIMQNKTTPSHKYFALKGSADNVALFGVPEVTIGVDDIFLEVNYSNHISTIDGKRLVVDFTDDELVIETSPTSSVVMNFADELIRARLSNGVFKLADFVHLSGNFAFEKGAPAIVDIATNIPGDFAKLGDLIPAQLKDFLDGFGDITDITRIEDVEVTTLYLGASEVNGFVGLNGPYYVTDENGQQIENNEAVGLSVENLNFGFVMMEPTLGALGSLTGLEGMLPKFYSLKASSDRVALVGVPEIVLEANAVSVSVNFGNTWIKGVESFGRPVVDFVSSFPAETTDSDGDGKIDPVGFELNTGSSSIYMDHAGELLIGASVGKAIMHLSEFVHLSGTMAFELGPTYMVTVDAGIPAEIMNLINQALAAAGLDTALQDLLDLLGLDLEAGTIEHEVISFTMGGSDINAFVGMDGPYWTDLDVDDDDGGGKISWVAVEHVNGEDIYTTLTDSDENDGGDEDLFVDVVTIDGKEYGDINTDGIVDANETAELNENAVGLVAADLDFGMAVMQSNNPIFDMIREVIGKIAALIPGAGTLVSVLATVLGEYIRPRYYAMKGTAGQIGFVGLDEIIAEAHNIVIEMNVATPAWGPFRPSLNFLKSFPDPDGAGPEQAGFKVDTGGEPVYLDFDTKLLRASVEKATLQLSEFLYLGGSFAFEAGPSHSVTVNSGIPPDLLALIENELSGASGSDVQEVLNLLGFDLETGTLTHGVDSFSIGGSNISLFAGVNGPYWTDLDPDDIDGGGKVSWVAVEHVGDEDIYTTLTDGEVVTIDGKKYGDINEDGKIQANETAELNEDAIGLVATDLDFGISVMQSNSPVFSLLAGIPPMAFLAELVRPRYFAVKGSAYDIGFIGMEEITAEIVNLSVQLNVATPWGPLLPSLDFVKSFPGEDLNDDNILDSEDINNNGILDDGEDANANGILDTEDKDGDGKLDPAGFEVFTGSDSYYMDFATGLVRVSVGQATLRIFNLVALSGGFAFCAEGKKKVTLTNGDKKDVAIMTIAAENVYGFVGVNGPYRWDTDKNGIIDDPVNTKAVGFAIDNFNLAMAIAVGLDILDPSIYFAMKSSADLFGFVGINGLEAESDGINIDVNVGLSLDSSAAIDFSKFDGGGLSVGFGESPSSSDPADLTADEKGAIAKTEFPTEDQVTILLGEGILQLVLDDDGIAYEDLVRFDESITDEGQLRERLEALDNDDIDVSAILVIWRENYNPRFLDFAKSLLKGHIAANISFLGVEFEGSFGFDEGENDSTILTVLAYFSVNVDDLTLYESLASGVLKIGDGGIAGKILLKSESLDPLADLGIEGLSFSQDTRFDLLINTTEKEADILLPDYFNVLTAFDLQDIDYSGGVVLSDMLTTLKSTGDSSNRKFHLYIPKNDDVPPQAVPDANPQLLGESYILVHADGKLAFPGILLEGTFDFKASGTEAMLIMDADFKIGAAGLSLLELKAAGVIQINSAGVAGKIKLKRTSDNLLEGLNIPGLNFGVDAKFDMLINTTLVDVDILLPEEFNVFEAFGLSDTDPTNYLSGVLLPDKITILQAQPRGPPENEEYDYYLTIPKNAVLPGQPQPDSNQGGQFYILVHAEGTLDLPGAKLKGSFNLFANESSALLVMGGHLLIGFDGLELLELVAGGAFQIDSTGFAGKLQLSLDEDLDSIPFGELFEGIGESLGFDLGVQFDLVANTTTYDKDILLPDNFDALTVFSVSQSDRERLEGVVEGADPEWVLLSDKLTRLQSQYNTDTEKVEYHLIIPKNSVPIDESQSQSDPAVEGEFYILVHAVGKLLFPGFVLDGGFDLFVYQQNAVMDIHAVMTVASFLQLNAIGILQIDDTGVAGKIALEIIDGNIPLSSLPGLGSGFGFDAEFNLIVNTTEQYKEIVFPERFNNLAAFGLSTDEIAELNLNGSVVLKDGLTRLKSLLNDDNETEYHLIVNNTPDKDNPPPVEIDDSPGEFYLLVYANGDLSLPGATLTGSFYLLAEDAQTVMTVSGHLKIGFGSINVLDLKAGGAFYLDDNGLAGKLQLELDQSIPFEDLFGPGFGFSQEAFFDLTINLTREVQDFTLPESFNAIDVFGVEPGAIQNAGDEVILSDNLTILRLVYNTTSLENEFHLIVPDSPDPDEAAEAYILLHAVGELVIPGFTLYGGFDLYVDQQRATMDIHALMTLGFGDMTVLQLEAIGVAQIDLTGLAGKIHLQIIDDAAPLEISGIETLGPIAAPLSQLPGLGDDLGFGVDAKFDLIINTTKRYKDILLPDRFDNLKSFGITDEQEDYLNDLDSTSDPKFATVLLPDGLTRLKSVYIESSGKIEYHLIINNTPDKESPPPEIIPTPNDTGQRYLVVHAEGELAFPGFKLEGTFDLEINEYFAVMAVNAQMVLGIPVPGTTPLETLTLLDLSAAGVLKMDSEGIAGKVKLSIDQGDTDSPDSVPFSDYLSQLGLDITIEADLDLLINTTRNKSEIELPDGFGPLSGFGLTGDLLDDFTEFKSDLILDSVHQAKLADDLTSLRAEVKESHDGTLYVAYTLIVPNTPDGQNDIMGQRFILVRANGQMSFPGFKLEGTFDLEINEYFAVMAVNAQMVLGIPVLGTSPLETLTLLDLSAAGVLKMDSEGIAGKVKLSIDQDDTDSPDSVPFSDFLSQIGLDITIEADLDLLINTTWNKSEIELPDGFDPLTGFDLTGDLLDGFTDFKSDLILDSVHQAKLADDLTSLRAEVKESHDGTLYVAYTLIVPNTPDGQNDIMGQRFILVRANGQMSFPGFELEGMFDLEMNDQFIIMAVSAKAFVGIGDLKILELVAGGLLKIDYDGFAGKLKLRLASDIDPASIFYDTDAPGPFSGLASGLTMNAEFDLILNTTEKEVSIVLPDAFDPFISFNISDDIENVFLEDLDGEVPPVTLDDELTTLESHVDTSRPSGVALTLTIPNTPTGQDDNNGEFYIIAHADGELIYSGFILIGVFDLLVMEDKCEIQVAASLKIGPLGLIEATGSLVIDEFGLVGQIVIDGKIGGEGIGIEVDGNFLLEINTGSNRSIQAYVFDEDGLKEDKETVWIETGILVLADVTIDFLGMLQAEADLVIEYRADRFYLEGNAHIAIGSFVDANMHIVLEVTDEGVIMGVDVIVKASVLEIITIDATGELLLNTRDYTVEILGKDCVANSFLLDLDGKVVILGVLQFDAGFKIQVGGGTFAHNAIASPKATLPTGDDAYLYDDQWAVSFGASMDFFGFEDVLTADGWFNYLGNFEVHLSGDLLIGSKTCGIEGNFNIDVSSHNSVFDLSGDASAGVYLVGYKVGGVDVEFDFDSATGEVTITGTLSVTINLLVKKITISASKTFTIGVLEIPKQVFLAGSSSDDTLPGGKVDLDGNLYLNIGSRASYRELAESVLNETFYIRHISGDYANGERIEVTCFGRTQEFSGVKHIIADGDAGNDMIIIREGVTSSVDLNGGSGNDVIIHRGPGGGIENSIRGGNGDDHLELGDDISVSVDLYGDGGNDYIQGGPGDDYIDAGSGNDRILGGDGVDTIYGGDGSDVIVGGLGQDSLYGQAGADTFEWASGDGEDSVIDGGSGSDLLVITASDNDEDITITNSGTDITITLYDVGLTSTLTLTGLSFEAIEIDMAGGSDSLTLEDIQDSNVTQVNLDLGNDDDVTDSVLLKGSTGNDSFVLDTADGLLNIRRVGVIDMIIASADRSFGDELAIETYAGSDTINAAAVIEDLLALTLTSGEGDDIIIGSPFNDELNSGSGSDTVTGNAGQDVFLDDSGPDDIDTLVEILDCDMSLFDNLFVAGTILADDGLSPFFKSSIIDEQNTPIDPDFPAPIALPLQDNGDVYAAGAEVESLLNGSSEPIFERAYLAGGDSNNVIVVGDLDGEITVVDDLGGRTLWSVTNWTGEVTLDNGANRGIGGDGYNEYYILNLNGTSGSIINILDTGGSDGFDEVYIFGTLGNDSVLLNAVRYGAEMTGIVIVGEPELLDGDKIQKMTVVGGLQVPLFYQHDSEGNKVQRTDADDNLIYDLSTGSPVAIYLETTDDTGDPVMVNSLNPDRDDVSFAAVERVTIKTLAGDDTVISKDTAAPMVVYLGDGEDMLIVGVVPQINDPGNVIPGVYPYGVPVADVENMSNGNSAVMTVYGENGDDEFEVNHNTSKLYLHGGADNDRFIINTFLVLKEYTDSDDISNLSTLFGGTGNNRYEYLQNAPVSIEGGTGNDILVINGTPINDTFIITNNFVAGAGVIVPFSGIETVEVNAGGGADKIYVMSSDSSLTINVNGGSGDDTIHLGGNPEILFFDPPATTYTPPSYQVQDPPVTAYETMALNFGQTTLTLDWNWMFYSFDADDARDAVSNYINTLVNLMSLFRPGLELTSSVDDIVAQSVIDYSYGFRWWIFDPEVYVTFDLAAIQLQYPTQALPPLRTVVPDPVTIDPPPFALKVDSSFNLSEIQGKVIINGGDTFETNGDKVIVHNQDGGEIPGTLTDVELTGLGLGEEGIEYNNLEEMTILFGNGSDTLTINDTHTGPLTVSMGPGDDTVFVEGISGETTILAGAGDDTINVAAGSKELKDIMQNLIIEADEGLTEQVDYLPYIDDYDVIQTQIYINSEPDLEYTDSGDNVISYAHEEKSRMIFEQSGDVWMWVAVLDPATGKIVQDLVQERNADGALLWLDSDGNKTTTEGNNAPSLIEVGRNKDVQMTQTEIIDTSGPGNDTLNVDDSWNDNDTAGVLTDNTLDISSMPGQISYSGVDLLNIDLGSGSDVFNVRSTIAVTNLSLHDGLDRIYVSSAADVGLTNTIDFLPGHLDDINSMLNIDAGDGKNLLMISDEGATIADSNILITDQLTADISITGIAPAAITYKAATSGSFASGVTIWTGSGSDTITIDGTHYRNAQYIESSEIRTITTLNTGAGDDNVTVSLDTSDGFFVLNTQSGNDIVDASASTLPLIIFGGDGQLDIIKGGLADDVIIGDLGTVSYYDDLGQPVTVLGNGGPGDKTDGIAHTNREVQADSNVGGNDLIYGQGGDDLIFGQGGDDLIFGDYGQVNDDGTLIETIQPNQGGADTIASGSGNDIIIGGTAGDTINAGSGNDLVFGDHGQITGNINVSLLPLETAADGIPVFVFTSIYTLAADGGGDDIIFGSAGKDIILGQQGCDTIFGGDGDDDIIGGHNVTGGFDAGDNLDGGAGDDVIAGDNAVITRLNASAKSPRMRVLEGTVIYGETIGFDDGELLIAEGQQFDPTGTMQRIIQLLDHSKSTVQDFFGSDYIAGGADNDMVFGQLGDDIIQGDGSIESLVDGNEQTNPVNAYRDENGQLHVSSSLEDDDSDGDDYIEGNGGNDIIFGNLGQDDIIGGSSELFGLDTAAERIDGEDMIFGGSGTDLARNNLGDNTLDNGHALDADVIVGDNGNIYRLVGVNGVDDGGYLTFNYDNYGTEKIIVRAAELIDYTPGGPDFDPTNAANDIGASDEIHGESGDDVIYGQTGDDVIFGEGQDDDLIGGWGCDFISGGAGIDGILGDDGRIYTSRNTAGDTSELSEPLYNIYNVQTDRNSDRMVISTPGKFQEAEINIIGQLLKTVNLSPFNLDPNVVIQDSLFDAENSDDILYGGIGGDFIHGGAGDDAISGAEALPEAAAMVYPEDMPTDALRTDGVVIFFGYDNPLVLSKLESELGYGVRLLGFETLRAEEFASYSEYEPLTLISIIDGEGSNAFFLNFNSDEGQEGETLGIFSDGDDRLFGDLGNDWIVGGTGRDHLYGGRGNDLLNADDDLSSNDGLNNIADGPEYSYDDIAYGGAGRDVLIANTGGDRLIDWVGEFNSYIAPSKNLPGTISRVLQPKLMEYLYNLSKSDGADQTRSIDTGNDPLRNGEPDGELGLVLQKDNDWHDQTGAPDDPQLGNIPGGKRDILTGADFNLGNLDNFGPDSGTWEISSGRLEVSPEALGGDAVSVLLVDQWIPSYFEVKATINAGKPTAGFKSNAYLIFDYQGPTDFKFAGINVSTDKLEMGHRDADGWHVDEQTNARLKPNRDYQLLLAINGTTATLIVNNKDVFTHVFAPRFDADGFSYALNAGMVGIGAFNSAARIDNVVVQVLPPETTLEITEDFEQASSELFTGPMSGLWQVVGSDFAATLSPGEIAFCNTNLSISASSLIRIEATFNSESIAGIVFDQYSETEFKFAVISALTNQVIIGHHSAKKGWQVDAAIDKNIISGKDYQLQVTLKGTTVSVALGQQVVLGFAYNANVVDGAFGLMARNGSSSFDSVTVSTNDPSFIDNVEQSTDANTLLASSRPDKLSDNQVVLLTEEAIDLIMVEAINRLIEQFDLGQIAIEILSEVTIEIGNLSGSVLGLHTDDGIVIDIDAAGYGWFVDSTPQDNVEFSRPTKCGARAMRDSSAYGKIDLLTVVMHELGHVIGLQDMDFIKYPSELMSSVIDTGLRRIDTVDFNDLWSREDYCPLI